MGYDFTCRSLTLAKGNWLHFSNRHKSSMLKEKNNSQMVVWWWLTMVQNQKSPYCQKKWYFLCFPGCIICIIQHGTWQYTPGISENHLNQTIIFRFEPLVFGAKNPSFFRSVFFFDNKKQSGDSWMYRYQRTPMGNPCIGPTLRVKNGWKKIQKSHPRTSQR